MYCDHQAYKPIRHLLVDPEITEIMINGPKQIFVERKGKMEMLDEGFGDARQLNFMIERMLEPTGRSISTATPFVDLRLPDGARVNVAIPPIALDGATVTIRKFTQSIASVADLVAVGTLSERMAQLLCAAVEGRANIVFSGATGTGKTTTLGILSNYIPESERIITIEDTAELQLQQKNVVRMECRRANQEGAGEIDLSQLVRNALRMRPTRILVGEVRGAEALDMLQAILTGHEGCLAVLHASTPVHAVSRLEMMSMSSGLQLPLWSIRKQIASAIDLIVQHELLPDGSRKVTYITEVCDVEGEHLTLRDLYEYRAGDPGADGREPGGWVCSGEKPDFLPKCTKNGVNIPERLYAAGTD